MKTKRALRFPQTLRELYDLPDFQPFGSTSDDWINDPERMARCHDAAEEGGEGSTHYEILSDWRAFLDDKRSEALRAASFHPRVEAEIERRAEAITEEIEACEAWHAEKGTLHDQLG